MAREKDPKTKPTGESKYAKKVRAGNQMYGPGCCAHNVKLDYWDHQKAKAAAPVLKPMKAA